ncbi:nucleotidyltransferase family protein [Nocardioides caricicola]|uniref:Nucleotidyltransferase family protein n=1 Tax=Nocardioides caricicola TaxID=634770 RepID=A0ABW0MUL5_9ACTN
MTVDGLLLAAGAGSRMGMPKALVPGWLARGVQVLTDGGCAPVTVVLGAGAEDALPLLEGTGASAVVAADWKEGMSASLRAGLAAAETSDADAVLLMLVDLPDVGADVVRRLLDPPPVASTLRRATYAGKPGHPVVLGREHWAAVAAESTGDEGARAYLAARDVELVECVDLATGRDADTP